MTLTLCPFHTSYLGSPSLLRHFPAFSCALLHTSWTLHTRKRKASVPEWSKGVVSRTTVAKRVGSNPTRCIFVDDEMDDTHDGMMKGVFYACAEGM